MDVLKPYVQLWKNDDGTYELGEVRIYIDPSYKEKVIENIKSSGTYRAVLREVDQKTLDDEIIKYYSVKVVPKRENKPVGSLEEVLNAANDLIRTVRANRKSSYDEKLLEEENKAEAYLRKKGIIARVSIY